MSDHGHGSHPPSTKATAVVLVMTFLFGFVAGVILFLKNNTGEGASDIPEVRTKGFTILAYMYGGCERGGRCPSYRIMDTGAYTYIVRGLGSPERRFEDTLNDTQISALHARLTEINLTAIGETTYTGTCPITFDGVAYRYEIEYKGERHTFDSCVEDLESDPLFATFGDYFELFRITHGSN